MQKCFHSGEIRTGSMQLSPRESHHLCSVARVRIGETICVLNGCGTVAIGKLIAWDGKFAEVEIDILSEVERPKCAVSLLQATLSSGNNDYVVREATAIGASEIVFFESQNSESRLKNKSENRLARWKIIAIEACKQSGNPFLPEISYCWKLAEMDASRFEAKIFGGLGPESRPLKDAVSCHRNACSLCVAIGPEGDFSASEYEYLKSHGFAACRFSKNILRSETAAIYALSAIDQLMGVGV
ncbi:MAG: 16S rRNA (uracil(1498)-N(3))-methyltransferase [Puniceicoccales bacterium]|jgi:16S rRNA (uracil1498-N3)-methyltransferase|nr:16S rRNA (uracil(1498)-N(3))-methyltransferase [Puniceicoccales bacterium]